MNLFRTIALLEGVSYILLIFIAMPLKYFWGQEVYVQVVGMIHGLLVVLYVIFSCKLYIKNIWSKKEFLIILLASIIPFGVFFIDKKYLKK